MGQGFITKDSVLNEKEVTLTDYLICSICWKDQLSQSDMIKEAFLISLLQREFGGLD